MGLKSRAEEMPELQGFGVGPVPSGGRCPRATIWKSSCKSRGCPVCGPRWARNQQQVLEVGLEWAHRKVATIAITAPGRDVLPWDCPRRHKHSGPRGCKVQERPLREWCETLGWRWQKLRQAARVATKRELHGQLPPWILARVWEPQKRGVPHLHLVVPYETWPEKTAADAFHRHLIRLAGEYGFGRVQPTLKAIEGAQAARYLANYLAGRTGKKSSIRENIADPKLPRSLVWLTPVVTSVSESARMVALREARGVRLGSGVTMRTLRRARHLWAIASGFFQDHPHWSGLEEAVIGAIAFRRVYPKRAGPNGDEERALAYAREIDRKQRTYLRCVWDDELREYVPNQPLFRELTRVAFMVTRGAEPEPVGA